MWDPAKYLDYQDERARPFYDLLARVGATSPRRVVDAGCGPGNLTASLSSRWPDAVVEAFDSSPDMVEAARANGIAASLRDVTSWVPPADTDVIVTNAVLQWVPTHREVLTRWVDALPPGAWLAMQVPGNFRAPSHELVRKLVATSRWSRSLDVRDEDAVSEPQEYAALLAAWGCSVDVWETTYVQRLTGEDPVLEWITGTVLRPIKAALDAAEWERFRYELGSLLRDAYPPNADGSTWFPFRRVFAVAHVN
ncbi:trans-aconitate 2-methyltransferase [Amycolatopsis sp. 195334CR]|uniref:trans-aconitate 2-methyltransferase n=1 Tax=Amycolatopsis sp. 195334CR TaxID=2814588 RepID=UPI001A8D9027|nr:trans-aconitate 2-methyltransferase [Amycolatopsis sp. 195334CR]MBN6037595.1 trans-aconitate 2-methyltransferase [Amycolatopsis sp. 195334CR]